jgi:hypothetical protein
VSVSRFAIMLSSRSTFARMASRACAWSGRRLDWSPCEARLRNPFIAVSGVRNSCETVESRSSLMRSISRSCSFLSSSSTFLRASRRRSSALSMVRRI